MHEQEITILRELIIILAASLPITYLFHRAKLPALVGFLITGVLIGPLRHGDHHRDPGDRAAGRGRRRPAAVHGRHGVFHRGHRAVGTPAPDRRRHPGGPDHRRDHGHRALARLSRFPRPCSSDSSHRSAAPPSCSRSTRTAPSSTPRTAGFPRASCCSRT